MSIDTLCSKKGTVLGAMFGGKWEVKTDNNGSVFIDRDGTLYEYILNYLRDADEVVLPGDSEKRRKIAKEAEYLGLICLVEMLQKGETPANSSAEVGHMSSVGPVQRHPWAQLVAGPHQYRMGRKFPMSQS